MFSKPVFTNKRLGSSPAPSFHSSTSAPSRTSSEGRPLVGHWPVVSHRPNQAGPSRTTPTETPAPHPNTKRVRFTSPRPQSTATRPFFSRWFSRRTQQPGDATEPAAPADTARRTSLATLFAPLTQLVRRPPVSLPPQSWPEPTSGTKHENCDSAANDESLTQPQVPEPSTDQNEQGSDLARLAESLPLPPSPEPELSTDRKDQGVDPAPAEESLPQPEKMSWIATFISSRGNEYFCEIDEDYLTDRFNLTGLNTEVQYYQYALDLVTDVFDMDVDDEMREQIEKSARHLYGLVHARYVVTTRGLAKMMEKYKQGVFGKCPRVICESQHLLPMGQHDIANTTNVKLYCAKCEDIYNPKSTRHSNIDGAYFGTSFHNILFQVYPALLPQKTQRRYEPRLYGFRVHASAALMRWQEERRMEMKERLGAQGVETGFEDEDEAEEDDMESEEEGEEGDDGLDDMFEGHSGKMAEMQ